MKPHTLIYHSTNKDYKLRHMTTFDSSFLLEHHFASLQLGGRESGLIDLIEMKWSNPSQTSTTKQYKDLYISRIKKMSSKLSKAQYTEIANVSKSFDSQDIDSKQYTIRGVLKKLQFNRVRAFEKNFELKYNGKNKVYDYLDEMEIEDETGKLKLFTSQAILEFPHHSKIPIQDLPSGVVVQVTGKFRIKSNIFIAKKILLPQLSPQQNIRLNYVNTQGISFRDKKVLIVSQPTLQTCAKIKKLVFSPSLQTKSIVAVIIIGGFELKIPAIQQMAAFVQQIKNYIDVFLMPSSTRDRQRMYPLEPYNGLYFIKSQMDVGLCANPQLFEAQNGVKIHVSCGQNVRDFMNNCSLASNDVQVLESMIRFGHYSPTCPYSLKTQPYSQDYLVMNEIPHVMIAGKAETFQTKQINLNGNKRCLLIAIPSNRMGVVNLEAEWAKELV